MKKIIFLFAITIFWTACQQNNSSETADKTENTSSEKTKLAEEILTLEKKILETKDATKNKSIAALLVLKSVDYATKFPSDTVAAKILFKAGDVARGMGNPEKAVEIFEQVYLNYPRTKIASEALFARGFTADVDLQDKSLAAKCYRSFLSKYPRHEHYEQVKLLLSVIEKSPEELVKEFQKKNAN